MFEWRICPKHERNFAWHKDVSRGLFKKGGEMEVQIWGEKQNKPSAAGRGFLLERCRNAQI